MTRDLDGGNGDGFCLAGPPHTIVAVAVAVAVDDSVEVDVADEKLVQL
jgi:hypothetical protein